MLSLPGRFLFAFENPFLVKEIVPGRSEDGGGSLADDVVPAEGIESGHNDVAHSNVEHNERYVLCGAYAMVIRGLEREDALQEKVENQADEEGNGRGNQEVNIEDLVEGNQKPEVQCKRQAADKQKPQHRVAIKPGQQGTA